MGRKRGGLAGIWDRNKKIIKPIVSGIAGLLLAGCGREVTAPQARQMPSDTAFASGGAPLPNLSCTKADTIPLANGTLAILSWHYAVCPVTP